MAEVSMDQMWADMDALLEENKPPPPIVEAVNRYICVCGHEKSFDALIPVCKKCGLTDSHNIDDGPEWVGGVSEDGKVSDPGRCGMAADTVLFSENWGRGTVINTNGASWAQKKMARINFHSSMNHRDRALFHAYADIDRAAAAGGLKLPPCVIRDAKVMYRKFNSEKLTRGAVRRGIKANCVMYACKMNNIPRTTLEIADAFDIPRKDVSRTADMFLETFGGKQSTKSSFTKPIDVVPRLLNGFEIDNKRAVRIKCGKMAAQLEKCVPLMSKTPSSTASVILMKCMDNVSKAVIIEKCNISLPTLNKIEAIVNKYLETIQ